MAITQFGSGFLQEAEAHLRDELRREFLAGAAYVPPAAGVKDALNIQARANIDPDKTLRFKRFEFSDKPMNKVLLLCS